MIKIIVDCLGEDGKSDIHVKACSKALNKFSDLSLVLTGEQNILEKFVEQEHCDSDRISIVNAPEIVSGNDKPTNAFCFKKESSMVKGIYLLKEDKSTDALISTGATGVLVVGSVLCLGRLKNVERPAFCPLLPTMNGGIVCVCDSGANIECTAQMLYQFAVMSSLYMQTVYNIKNPRIALLNIGTEAHKGDKKHQDAFKLLSDSKEINFVGNMESRDLLSGKYDIVVCDGFSGNVLIKSTEGTAFELMKRLKKDVYSKMVYKIGGFFMKRLFENYKNLFDYHNYGGSVLLGISKIVVKGHGNSNTVSILKCIEQAYLLVKNNFCEEVINSFDLYNGGIMEIIKKTY